MVRPTAFSNQPSHSASPSVASASSVGSIFFLPQYMNITDPSYISLDAANAIVSSYPPPETTRNLISKDIIVTSAGLRTINMFLDYILHEFLARAKATSLLRLREAVALVIRTTLGTAAMVEAEQELAAYLHDSDTELYANGDESDEEMENGQSSWNLEKVWARSRTKCMIYSTLGDKEEEDFEEDSEEDADYDLPPSKRKLSPAGAIYLTAVLEFIGEHCFLVSARTAYHRLGNALRASDPPEPVPLTIEDIDVKRGIAEDDLTTRIWRKWKRSEKLVATMSTISASHQGGNRHTAVDTRSGSDTLTKLPFTQAHGSNEGPPERRRNSIVSAPDMFRDDSLESAETRTQSLPISPIKSTSSRKYKHRSQVYSDSGTVRQSESVTNIKEMLGERGVTLPDSPRSSRDSSADDRTSPRRQSHRRHSNGLTESSNSESPPVLKEIIPNPKAVDDDDTGTEYLDALATPRGDSPNLVRQSLIDDPLKTPTPHNTTQFFEDVDEVVTNTVEEDAYIMGGEAGLDVFPCIS
jgi:hypothetical protein